MACFGVLKSFVVDTACFWGFQVVSGGYGVFWGFLSRFWWIWLVLGVLKSFLVDTACFGGFKVVSDKIKKAYSVLGVIKRNFKKMDEDTFIKIYKTMVRSKIEYAASVWSPHKKTLINTVERVQKRATKMIRKYRKISYAQRLKKLKLPTLVYRRLRGDMIEMYKIQTGKYDKELTQN